MYVVNFILMQLVQVLYIQVGRVISFFFFFQAEDGIRDIGVTGVQTCALPISKPSRSMFQHRRHGVWVPAFAGTTMGMTWLWLASSTLSERDAGRGYSVVQIGRASCRERV